MRIILLIFVLLNIYAVNAQPVLQQLDKDNLFSYPNSLVLFSDVDNPLKSDKIRKLVSDKVILQEKPYTTYHFEDSEMNEQWFKNFVFFKQFKPSSYYEGNRIALYDVCNKQFLAHPKDFIGSKYFVTQKPSELTTSKQDFFLFEYLEKELPLIPINISYKRGVSTSKKFWIDYVTDNESNLTYLHMFEYKNKPINFLNIFVIPNADFINDDIPDKTINNNAKYLFLQRDYKLGQKYNTVIFPVDVTIQQYNHVYNNGLSKMVVYRLDTADLNSLEFVRDDSGILKADVPYILKSQIGDNTTDQQILSEYYYTEQKSDSFDINITKPVMDQNDVQIIAQYSQNLEISNSSLDTDSDVYIVSDNKLYNCHNIEKTSINRFRWYVKRPAAARAVPMTMFFDGTTDIECVEQQKDYDNAVYDITGRKVGQASDLNGLDKGYYIVKGKVRYIGD